MQKFLARQPIFNAERIVYGYELLFRSGPENYFSHPPPGDVCAATLDNLVLIGMESLTQGRRAFINCGREFLIRGYPLLLPRERVVLEILETTQLDGETIAACKDLKSTGYLIALDDYVDSPAWRILLPLADFIKMDVLASPEHELRRMAREFAQTSVRLLAEKVETHEMFQRTAGWGYTHFQGYFFRRPQILGHRDVPAGKLACLRILQAANRTPIDMDEIAGQIKSEVSFSYRLLRYLNSPCFSLVAEIHSIPQSLRMLGERAIRKWVSLVAIASRGDGKPEELIVLPLVRARCCELLASAVGLPDDSNDLFLLGLLSVLDALLDMRMADVLREIAIRPDIRGALLGERNLFRNVLDIVLFYEAGDWDELEKLAARIDLDVERIPSFFLQAVEWARGLATGQETVAT